MAKYIDFSGLKDCTPGLKQFPGTLGKHKLQIISVTPQKIQVRGVASDGTKGHIVTLLEGQTLGYDMGKVWVVKPYSGNDPVLALLNKYKLPKDVVRYVAYADIYQDGEDMQEYAEGCKSWNSGNYAGEVVVKTWPQYDLFEDDLSSVLPKRINHLRNTVGRNGYDDVKDFLYVAHGTEQSLIIEAIWQCLLKFHDRYTWDSSTNTASVRPDMRHTLFKVEPPHNGYCRQVAQTKLAVWQKQLDDNGSKETISSYVLRMLQRADTAFLAQWFTEEGLPLGTAQDVVKICASVGLHIPYSLGLSTVKQWVQPTK